MKESQCLFIWRAAFLLALIGLVSLSGCAPLLFKQPLSDREQGNVATLLKAQDEAAATFFTTGHVVVKDWYWDQEANTLLAGTRTPLRLRMEITHGWGQPILHLLVVGKTFKALAYMERKLYMGDLAPGALSKFFPADLDADLIWDALRGFPKPRPFSRLESRKVDQVSLLDRNGDDVMVLDIDHESGLPKQAT
ncbi:MAG: hypothetical protein ACM34H_07060, partial [Deltaproteobacteria bacterium]